MTQNASPEPQAATDAEGDGAIVDIVDRATRRALAGRQAAYAREVRSLLDAGLEVMRRYGTTRSPRVADIVEEAELSREAFYRHFASKEDLVAAIVEAGAQRLVGYLRHQMAKETDAAGRLRCWVRGILSQAANPEVADATRAVLWNGDRVAERSRPASVTSDGSLAGLIAPSLAELGSVDPERDATLATHAVMGLMRDSLWRCVPPTPDDEAHLVAFCTAAVGGTRREQ